MPKKLFLIIGLTMLFSCSIFKPMQRDQNAISQLTQIQKDAEFIYSHPDFVQSEYDVVDNEISSLIVYDATRKNVDAIVDNVKQLQKIFSSQEARHKAKVTLNATLLTLYKTTVDDKITDILTAENKLK